MKLPWTIAAPDEVSPNITSATMLEASISRPQPVQNPSLIGANGLGHCAFGHFGREDVATSAEEDAPGAGDADLAFSLSMRFNTS